MLVRKTVDWSVSGVSSVHQLLCVVPTAVTGKFGSTLPGDASSYFFTAATTYVRTDEHTVAVIGIRVGLCEIHNVIGWNRVRILRHDDIEHHENSNLNSSLVRRQELAMSDTVPLIPKDVPPGCPVTCRCWHGLLILLGLAIVIAAVTVAFIFYPTPLGGCTKYTCDWIVLWDSMSGCIDGICVYDWQVVVDGSASGMLWTTACDRGNYTSSCVYASVNEITPPQKNGTVCYRPQSYFCDNYAANDWWQTAYGNCQPVFNCTLRPQTSHRNTVASLIAVLGGMVITIITIVWYCGMLNALTHGVSCYIHV